MTQTENVQLTLPAKTEYEGIAQTTIAHLAIRRGYTLKEVEDLRLIMAETTKLLLGSSRKNESLRLSYEVTIEQLRLEAFIEEQNLNPLSQKGVERFKKEVGDLVDNFSINNKKNYISLTKLRLETES